MTDRYDQLDEDDDGSIKYYSRAGKPIKLGTWCRLLSDPNYKSIARDPAGPFIVSTIWLGFDHAWPPCEPEAPPVMFETMVFVSPDGRSIVNFAEVFGPWRFDSEVEALVWHQQIVGKLREITADETKRLTPGDVRALLDADVVE